MYVRMYLTSVTYLPTWFQNSATHNDITTSCIIGKVKSSFSSIWGVERKLYNTVCRGEAKCKAEWMHRNEKLPWNHKHWATLNLVFKLSWRGGERQREIIITFSPHGGLVLMTQSNISLAEDGCCMTAAGSLTSSLHGFSKLQDISLWVKPSRLSHCSAVSNLVTNNKITTVYLLYRNEISTHKA